jgi:hypothetical protein
MFTHIVMGTNDIERAWRFDDATLSALGIGRVMNREATSLWGTEGPEFTYAAPVRDTDGHKIWSCCFAPS